MTRRMRSVPSWRGVRLAVALILPPTAAVWAADRLTPGPVDLACLLVGMAGLMVGLMVGISSRLGGGHRFAPEPGAGTLLESCAAPSPALRDELRRALDRGEFVLHFQPQLHIGSGALVGAEALARWHHPERGLLSPAAFIPAAEETGLIAPLGEWIVREACRQSAVWREAGLPPLMIAVNLSSAQFLDGSLERGVKAALADSGLDPGLLELELTETILLQDSETVLRSVRRLSDIGVSFAIDDFGTGWSNLSYLKRFRVDTLKIDRSFVGDLTDNPESSAIVRAVIQIARSLQLQTVAEGVEDIGTLICLRHLGCELAQGYFTGRPMPAAEFKTFQADAPATARKLTQAMGA